jgi:hypothetical protein
MFSSLRTTIILTRFGPDSYYKGLTRGFYFADSRVWQLTSLLHTSRGPSTWYHHISHPLHYKPTDTFESLRPLLLHSFWGTEAKCCSDLNSEYSWQRALILAPVFSCLSTRESNLLQFVSEGINWMPLEIKSETSVICSKVQCGSTGTQRILLCETGKHWFFCFRRDKNIIVYVCVK